MANSIAKASKYVPMLDEVYQNASLTAVLDGPSDLVSQGANADELIIPKMSLQGLGDYDRNTGYTMGDVTMTNETVKCNYDRGRMFQIDDVDNEETAGIAYGRVAGEFIRTKVAPEEDAFRLAAYASAVGISKADPATLADGPSTVKALRAAFSKMTEDEVPLDQRYLFITPTLMGDITDMDTTKSREILKSFAGVIQVPQTRFYTAIKLKKGKDGEAEGGYAKAPGAADINFMIIHKGALIQFTKHTAPKIVSPDANQSADAWRYGYRKVGIADVYENKTAGIYLHHKLAG